mgnify:CR=1 FL=1
MNERIVEYELVLAYNQNIQLGRVFHRWNEFGDDANVSAKQRVDALIYAETVPSVSF